MDALYHHQILKRALGAHVSLRALEAIYRANIGQDLRGLFGHPEYHFDENAIVESLAYIEECRALATRTESPAEAWSAFGRLSHAAQDFYAHSNYVRLWAAQFDGRAPLPGPREAPPERSGGGPLVGKTSDRGREWPPVEAMDGLDPSLLKHPRRMTCRMYWPVEALYFVPGLGPLVKRFLPKDAHAWMNLDNPKTGRLFPYAMEAAVQRTVAEYERTIAAIGEERGEEAVKAFCDVRRVTRFSFLTSPIPFSTCPHSPLVTSRAKIPPTQLELPTLTLTHRSLPCLCLPPSAACTLKNSPSARRSPP